MIDTVGRLQNGDNLMAELEKIGRITKRVLCQKQLHETFGSGCINRSNALCTAPKNFKITPLTGIVLTKIDGTVSRWCCSSYSRRTQYSVKLIGFVKIDDIGEFNSENFAKGLFEA